MPQKVHTIDNKNNLIVCYKYHACLCIDYQVCILSDTKLRKKELIKSVLIPPIISVSHLQTVCMYLVFSHIYPSAQSVEIRIDMICLLEWLVV